MKPVKIILDTDIGDDIDDAFALAFAVDHPGIDLVGVTTVFKNTHARAKQVAKFLHETNKATIPVCAGVKMPFIEPIHFFENDIKDELGVTWPCQYDASYEAYPHSEEHAVDFIIRTAHELKGELVIVPIGPLTNIASAIKKDATLKNNVKKIVLMGGWATNPAPEWNILCDPEAADIVFKSGIPVYAVGLDVTLQCTLDGDILDLVRNQKTPDGKLLSLWFDRWSKHFNFNKSVMHDPLAVATLVADLCTFEEKRIAVDLIEKRGSFKVLKDSEADGSVIHVATAVNREAFYELFRKHIFK